MPLLTYTYTFPFEDLVLKPLQDIQKQVRLKFHACVTVLIIIVRTDYRVGVYHLLP